ncbi:MAG: hypothetical protein JNM20_16800 [Rhizobiales bacterium]|nr:hypothetical protein [Hyphomicrobiales bacterium]
MNSFVTLVVVLLVFAAVVGSVVYFTTFEKTSDLPTRRPFYILFGLLLIVAVLLFLLYEFGIVDLGMS